MAVFDEFRRRNVHRVAIGYQAGAWLDKMAEQEGSEKVMEIKTELYDPIKSDSRWLPFPERHGAEDRDLSHIEFNPQRPASNWKPAEIRPASTT